MAAPHSWGTAALGTRHGRGAHTASLFILFKTAEADLGALYFRSLEMCMILKHCNSIFFYHLSRTSFEKINFLEVFSKHLSFTEVHVQAEITSFHSSREQKSCSIPSYPQLHPAVPHSMESGL